MLFHKKFSNLALFLMLPLLTASCLATQQDQLFPLDPSHRPKSLQDSINGTFRHISSTSPPWGYNGASEYSILEIRAKELLHSIICAAPHGQKEFFILDLGAGDFPWGNAAVAYLNKIENLKPDIKINIFSVTGEDYGPYHKKTIGHCTHHMLSAFKIENLTDDFQERGFNLEHKLDFIVSSYTFIHLHDPIGTFVQAYNLLRPESGLMLSDGFPVYFGPKEHYFFDHLIIELLLLTKAPFLVTPGGERLPCSFLLKRPNDNPLRLYLEYAGTVLSHPVHTAQAKTIAYFKPLIPLNDDFNIPQNTSKIVGDFELFDWMWKNYPRWQTQTCVWESLDGTKTDTRRRPPLFEAAFKGKHEELEKLLKQGADVNAKNVLGSPLIFQAFKTDVQLLIIRQPNFDPNQRGSNGDSVAHRVHGEALLIELLKKNPDLNVQDCEGNTPLHVAIKRASRKGRRQEQNLKDVTLLLENGVATDVKNNDDKTAFELDEARWSKKVQQIISNY